MLVWVKRIKIELPNFQQLKYWLKLFKMPLQFAHFQHLFRGRVSDTCSKTLQISGMAADNFSVVITVCGDQLGKSQVLQLEIHESLIVCLSLRLIFRVPARGI